MSIIASQAIFHQHFSGSAITFATHGYLLVPVLGPAAGWKLPAPPGDLLPKPWWNTGANIHWGGAAFPRRSEGRSARGDASRTPLHSPRAEPGSSDGRTRPRPARTATASLLPCAPVRAGHPSSALAAGPGSSGRHRAGGAEKRGGRGPGPNPNPSPGHRHGSDEAAGGRGGGRWGIDSLPPPQETHAHLQRASAASRDATRPEALARCPRRRVAWIATGSHVTCASRDAVPGR